MKLKFKEKLKKFTKISNFKILILCIIIVISIIYYYEDYREVKIEIPTKDVIILTANIPENIIIEKSMLTIEKRYKEDVIKESNIATTYEEVVGKRTKVPIYKGETINNDRLLVNQEYMNDKENTKEISFQLEQIDQALNLKKGDYIDIWIEPIKLDNEKFPEKLFKNLYIKDVVNSNKKIINENSNGNSQNGLIGENSTTDDNTAIYVILTLTDKQIEKLYKVDKTIFNVKIARYKDSDFYKTVNESINTKQNDMTLDNIEKDNS